LAVVVILLLLLLDDASRVSYIGSVDHGEFVPFNNTLPKEHKLSIATPVIYVSDSNVKRREYDGYLSALFDKADNAKPKELSAKSFKSFIQPVINLLTLQRYMCDVAKVGATNLRPDRENRQQNRAGSQVFCFSIHLNLQYQ